MIHNIKFKRLFIFFVSIFIVISGYQFTENKDINTKKDTVNETENIKESLVEKTQE